MTMVDKYKRGDDPILSYQYVTDKNIYLDVNYQ